MLAVATPQAVMQCERYVGIEVPAVFVRAGAHIVGMNSLGPAILEFLLQAPTSEIEPWLIEIIANLVWARHPDQDGRRICNDPESLFAFEQRLPSFPLVGHVNDL